MYLGVKTLMSKVIAVDTNVLVYWVNVSSNFHQQANDLFSRLRKESVVAVITWQNMTEFFAVVTDKKRLPQALKPNEAIEWIQDGIDSGVFALVLPNERTGQKFLELVRKTGVIGQRVHDVFFAATLLSNGVDELITENEKDFVGIKGLRVSTLKVE